MCDRGRICKRRSNGAFNAHVIYSSASVQERVRGIFSHIITHSTHALCHTPPTCASVLWSKGDGGYQNILAGNMRRYRVVVKFVRETKSHNTTTKNLPPHRTGNPPTEQPPVARQSSADHQTTQVLFHAGRMLTGEYIWHVLTTRARMRHMQNMSIIVGATTMWALRKPETAA